MKNGFKGLKSTVLAKVLNYRKKGLVLSGKEHAEMKSKMGVKNLRRFLTNSSKIRYKLIISFMVPIAFIIFLGLVSFRTASEGIIKNYETSSVQTIRMTGEYLRLGLESVKACGIQYSNDNTINNYFSNLYADNKTEYNSAYKYINSFFSAKQISDEFIGNLYIISDTVKSIATKSINSSGLYEGFTGMEPGSYLKQNRTKDAWTGKNEYLDENLKTTATDYSVRLIRSLNRAQAMLIIDVSMEAVSGILNRLEFDKSGFLAVVTSDGKEILAETSKAEKIKTDDNSTDRNSKEESISGIFYGEEFYQKAFESEAAADSQYVKYKGKDYLFMYSKVGDTNALVCALMPKAVITSQADNIKKVTIAVVILASLLAAAIALAISQGIDKTLKGIILQLKEAANGDLTVRFNSKRKDEFHILIDEIQNTFNNMKNLIHQVNGLSTEVAASSENVTNTSEVFLKASKDISTAMYEIEQGVTQQAADAQECLIQMDNLSNKISLVSGNTSDISQIVDKAKISITEGTKVTEALNRQSHSTIEISTDIIRDIERLDEKSLSISNIINVINGIASQTNLLSLNASIEAARAGEYGRGFAVVASEIRKLAEQSQNSVNDIRGIIESIQEDTKKAVGTAKTAEQALQLQKDAVKDTMDSYHNINHSVEQLMVFLTDITQNVDNIEESRVSTLRAIENISAVLEEIAASSNTVNQTSMEQITSVEILNGAAGMLNQNADMLVQEVKKFRVE